MQWTLPKYEEMMTRKDVATMLGVCEKTVRNAEKDKDNPLKSHKVGPGKRLVRYFKEEVEEYAAV
jgi:hypothetical protein